MARRFARSGVAAIVAAGVVLAGALPAQAQQPVIKHGTLTYYYSSAAYTTVVGMLWLGSCPGDAWGTRTGYSKTVETTC